MDKVLFAAIVIFASIICLIFYNIYSDGVEKESKYENCYQKGGSLIKEYKSELYVCAKVERIKS